MASCLQPPLPVFDLCAFIFHSSLCSSISPLFYWLFASLLDVLLGFLVQMRSSALD